MAVTHRGAISFGMVHIPVGLYTATQDNDIYFNQLCKEDGSRYSRVCWKTRPRKNVWKKKACHEESPNSSFELLGDLFVDYSITGSYYEMIVPCRRPGAPV